MSNIKKILIISLSAGAGHVRAAQALEKTANQQFPNLEIIHIDMMDYVSKPIKTSIVDLYKTMIKRAPKLWGFLYKSLDNPITNKHIHLVSKTIKNLGAKRFFEKIKEESPDYILCTHPFPGDIVAHTKEIDIPFGIVITDYDIHELWLVPGASHYFVATEEMKQKMISHGLAEEKICISGIPIDPVFYQIKKLEPTDKTTVLVLAGGQGLSKTDTIVKALLDSKEPLAIIAIAGKNKPLQTKIENLNTPSHITLEVIGWTDKIQEYMKKADFIITKPGGVTTTECIILNKQMIVINPIPGQEEANATFIEKNGYGIITKTPEDILEYISHPPIVDPERSRREQKQKTGMIPVAGTIILQTITNQTVANQ